MISHTTFPAIQSTLIGIWVSDSTQLLTLIFMVIVHHSNFCIHEFTLSCPIKLMMSNFIRFHVQFVPVVVAIFSAIFCISPVRPCNLDMKFRLFFDCSISTVFGKKAVISNLVSSSLESL